MFTEFRLKIRNFIKRNKRKIYLALIVWFIIIAVNFLIKNTNYKEIPSTTYTPHIPIMGGNEIKSSKKQKQIETILDKYINYCNSKEYESAYDLLSTQCKDEFYSTLEKFRSYVDNTFETKKVYTIQNYYNNNKTMVYRIRMFDDILATGLGLGSELEYTEELITIFEEDNKTVLSINNYIGNEDIKSIYDDKYVRITIDNVEKNYDTETYTVTVSNKTQYRVALLDNSKKNEILLKLSVGTRAVKNLSNSTIVLTANEKRTFELVFTRYYHESDIPIAIKFNDIRVVREYPYKLDENGEIIDKIEEYSTELKL